MLLSLVTLFVWVSGDVVVPPALDGGGNRVGVGDDG